MASRSLLSSPGSERSMLEKAAGSGADEIILDLEDAVAPGKKAEARGVVVDALREVEWPADTVSVRVNAFGTGLAAADVRALVEAGGALDSVILPDITGPEDVHTAAALLSELEAEAGVTDPIGIGAHIETVGAVQRVDAVAAASDRVGALLFGPGDYAASQGAQLDSVGAHGDSGAYPGDVWHYARSRIAVAAASNGQAAIDGPFGDFTDEEGLRAECERARALGFDGKWAIHPAQVDTINDVFAGD